jgi:hypothetical protein
VRLQELCADKMQSEVLGTNFYYFWFHHIFFFIIHTQEYVSYNCVTLQYKNTLLQHVRSVSGLFFVLLLPDV